MCDSACTLWSGYTCSIENRLWQDTCLPRTTRLEAISQQIYPYRRIRSDYSGTRSIISHAGVLSAQFVYQEQWVERRPDHRWQGSTTVKTKNTVNEHSDLYARQTAPTSRGNLWFRNEQPPDVSHRLSWLNVANRLPISSDGYFEVHSCKADYAVFSHLNKKYS